MHGGDEKQQHEIKNLGSDSKASQVINEAKNNEDKVENNEGVNEKKGDNISNAVEDDKLQCHDRSASNSDYNSKSGSGNDSGNSSKSGSRLGSDKGKRKEKAKRKSHKKRARALQKEEGTLFNSAEVKLQCHISSSKSNSGDDSDSKRKFVHLQEKGPSKRRRNTV